MGNAEPEDMVQGIVTFLLHCTAKSSYKTDMQYVQYKYIVGYNDQSKLCRCTCHAERWQVLAATKLKIYQNIWLICTKLMFFVSIYMPVNNSPKDCLISTINHTGRGCCQRYWRPLVYIIVGVRISKISYQRKVQ